MQLDIGAIVEGKVTGITKFGAFVEIDDGVTGLVHISEISKDYVTDVADFLERGDIVKVKVLTADEKRLSLSLKDGGTVVKSRKTAGGAERDKRDFAKDKNQKPAKSVSRPAESPKIHNPLPKKEEPLTFEEMLSRFKKNSEEKISDIKKNLDGKRGSYSKRR